MENSTKGLLIVATVLVFIIIIALAINVLNSNKSTADNAEQVGNAIAVESDILSKDLEKLLDNLENKNLVDIPDKKWEFNYWYQNYFPQNPKVLLEPNTQYILSFDYKINYADYPVGCGIGYGEKYYAKDIIYIAKYPNQTVGMEGIFVKTFTTPAAFNTDKPYLQLRFARMNESGKVSVEISNVKFKKVK